MVRGYILITDINNDWDDHGMIATAVKYGLNNVLIITVSGDTVKRAKMVKNIIDELGTNVLEHSSDQGKGLVTFNHGFSTCYWKIAYAKSTPCSSPEMDFIDNIFSPVSFEDIGDNVFPHKVDTWSVLFAGPPCGFNISHFPISKAVFVGNDPRGLEDISKRGINGGAGLRYAWHIEEVIENISYVASQTNIVFLKPEISRKVMQNSANLQENLGKSTTKALLYFTQKFLLGERPGHLPAALQLRIAKSNFSSLQKLSNYVTVNNDSFKSMAVEYADKFPEITGEEKMDLIETTKSIYELRDYILSYGDDPSTALKNYIDQQKEAVELLPRYDITGLQILYILENSESAHTCFENESEERRQLTIEILNNDQWLPTIPGCSNCSFHGGIGEVNVLFPCLNVATLNGYTFGYSEGQLIRL